MKIIFQYHFFILGSTDGPKLLPALNKSNFSL